jgi:hypothetical protein
MMTDTLLLDSKKSLMLQELRLSVDAEKYKKEINQVLQAKTSGPNQQRILL